MKIFIFVLFVSVLTTGAVEPVFAAVAAPPDPYGLEATAQKAALKKADNATVPVLAGRVIGAALSMIGVLFFILMIYGGFLWMTAKGDEGQSKKALDTITAAAVGMIIILAAYAITNFVFRSVTLTQGSCQTVTPPPRTCLVLESDSLCNTFDSQTRCNLPNGCCIWR